MESSVVHNSMHTEQILDHTSELNFKYLFTQNLTDTYAYWGKRSPKFKVTSANYKMFFEDFVLPQNGKCLSEKFVQIDIFVGKSGSNTECRIPNSIKMHYSYYRDDPVGLVGCECNEWNVRKLVFIKTGFRSISTTFGVYIVNCFAIN